MNKVDLSIVIVTYNSETHIKECVESIVATCLNHSFEIVVVDNNSRDKTGDILLSLKKKHSQVSLVLNAENAGFSKANNIGVKDTSGKYLLFINPDTKVYENTVDGMITFMEEHENCGAATCRVDLPSGKLDDSCHRGFPTPWRAFCHFSGLAKTFSQTKLFGGYNLSYLKLEQAHEIDALAGSFMMIPREVGDALNWWDEDYFFYGEDIDFCYRLKERGFNIYFVPEYKATHYKGVSSGIKKVSSHVTSATQETRLRATNERFRAMKLFYKKHYKKKYPGLVTGMVMLGINLKLFLAKRSINS